MNTTNPDVGKYEEITDLITDLLKNGKSHDRFTLHEMRALTECYIMLKRKTRTATNTHNIFSRGSEMRYKYQEERLDAHAAEVTVGLSPKEALINIADYVNDWDTDQLFSETSSDSDTSSEVTSEDLTKSVIMNASGKLSRRKVDDKVV